MTDDDAGGCAGRVRLTVASTAIVDATLDGWIAYVLRFHSVQFPRRVRVDLDCTAGTQEYALPRISGMSIVC